MLRRREPTLTKAEVNGLIILFMRLEANVARIARQEDENGGDEEE